MELDQTPVAKSEMLIQRPVAEASDTNIVRRRQRSLPHKRKGAKATTQRRSDSTKPC